jgi:protein TonB
MPEMNFNPPEPNHPAPVLQPAAEGPHLGEELREENVFSSLVSSFRDVFFPAKLPPLVLESKPVAVPDRMAVKRSPTSTAIAVAAHVAIILIIGFLIARQVVVTATPPKQVLTQLTVPPPPPILPPAASHAGGGGGQHDLAPVTKGRMPKFDTQQIVPPKAPPAIPPKLAVPPTVVVPQKINMANNDMPNIGAPDSTLRGVSMGNGSGTGLGSGHGAGVGPGEGMGIGGGVYTPGVGGVKPPSVIYSVDPEFSEEARKAKFSGNVLVALMINDKGLPYNVHVLRGVGMGLDEKAVEAVKQYRFKPATKDGKPVPVQLTMDVNFQIF